MAPASTSRVSSQTAARTWRANPYPGDARAYPIQLPDLVRPQVKVEDGVILVWTAQA